MYATPQDMIDRFGIPEMLRLSRPEERDAEEVDEAVINNALEDAVATIDGYLRGRYQLPIQTPPKDLIRATCHLARYDLADTGRSEPSDHMVTARKEIMAWLSKLSKDEVRIDAPAAGSTNSQVKTGGAKFSDRKATLTDKSLRGW